MSPVFYTDRWECAELLVKQGANLNKTDCHFGTPLHAAVSKGCLQSAKVLLKAGELNTVKWKIFASSNFREISR